MLKTKSRFNWTYFVFFISALVLLTLSILSYRRFEQQKISSDWVNHTYLVKLKLEEAFSTILAAEGIQRGYLLTRDSIFLNLFLQSRSTAPQLVSQIDSMLYDNTEQKQNLKEFDRLARSRITWLARVIDVSNTNVTDKDLKKLLLDGKLITDSLRVQMNRMLKEEDDLLRIRIDEKHRQEKRAAIFILFFSLFSLLVLVYSFFRLKNESRLLGKAEYNAELLEQKVNERTEEIKKINQKLNEQNRELELKNADLASFTFVASHDLKEPLRKIEIYAEKISRTEKQFFSENGKIHFDRIIASTKRMQNLIDSVSQYAQTGSVDLEFKPVDLNQIAAHAIEILNETIIEKGAVIEYSNLPTIDAISEQMEQLFTNLIGNAIKYSKSGDTPFIKIVAQKIKAGEKANLLTADAWKIDFSDNGIGFDERYLEKIFQMFQRLHNKDTYSGTGIGLAICKKIAENHKGLITASSSPGEGSTFSVFLPLTLNS